MNKINYLKIQYHLKKGGIIAYPTESCYGLGCMPSKIHAIKKIIKIKKRHHDKGFIIIGDKLSQFKSLIQKISNEDALYLNSIWPDNKTFLLPCKITTNLLIKGKQNNKIAIRIPNHKLARNLCKIAKSAIISTSANITKKNPCKNYRQVRKIFKNIMIIKGKIGKNKKPSQLIDFKTSKILRG